MLSSLPLQGILGIMIIISLNLLDEFNLQNSYAQKVAHIVDF